MGDAWEAVLSWLHVVLFISLGIAVLALILYLAGRWLERREPYASFMRLRARHKLMFFRLLLSDRRAPRRAKMAPLLLAGYLALPIDIIPDFIPVLGYVDDVAMILGTLALVIRWTPRPIVDDILRQLSSEGVN